MNLLDLEEQRALDYDGRVRNLAHEMLYLLTRVARHEYVMSEEFSGELAARIRRVLKEAAMPSEATTRGPGGVMSTAEREAYLAAKTDHMRAQRDALLEFCVALRDRYNTDDRLGGLGDWLIDVIAKAEGATND